MKNVGNKMLMQRFLRKKKKQMLMQRPWCMAKLYETEYEYDG